MPERNPAVRARVEHVFPFDLAPAGPLSLGPDTVALARLARLSLPVPPGFVVTAGTEPAEDLRAGICAAVAPLEQTTGRRLGAEQDPLLLIVGSDSPDHHTNVVKVDSLDRLTDAVLSRRNGGNTSVVVQAVVSGAADEHSGSGVVFTRDPATGSPSEFGRFFPGCDIDEILRAGGGDQLHTLRALAPEAFAALESAISVAETVYRDMCQIAFTVESGRLWIFRVRPGRRNAAAALRIAVDLVDEGLIDVPEARERVPIPAIARLQGPVLAAGQSLDVLARGVPEAPGVAVGTAAFELTASSHGDVLFCNGNGPPDPAGTKAAALVSSEPDGLRRLVTGPPAVWVEGLVVQPAEGRALFPTGGELHAGDAVTVDGGSGVVVAGTPATVPAQPDTRITRLLEWCEDTQVPVVAEAPEGAMVIELGEDFEACAAAALASGDGPLAVRIPSAGAITADPHPPAGPWVAVVAPPGREWAARLLAARLEISPAAPG